MKRNSLTSTRNLVMMGMLSAIAAALMYIEIPLPFLAPPFYKLDFSEVPVLMGTLLSGPVAGIVIEAIKILLHLLLKGTSTAYVGELGNFIVGVAFILPVGLIYKRKKTLKSAVLGMIMGTVCMVVAGSIMNAFVLLPLYATMYYGSMEPILAAGAAINANVNDVTTFVVLMVAPFNLLKAVLCSVLSYGIYIPVHKAVSSD